MQVNRAHTAFALINKGQVQFGLVFRLEKQCIQDSLLGGFVRKYHSQTCHPAHLKAFSG